MQVQFAGNINMHTTLRFGFIAYFLFVADFRGASSQNLKDGDQCLLKDGTQGICTLLINCQTEVDLLRKGVVPSNLCGFKKIQALVCCKDTSHVTVTTPTTASSTLAKVTRPQTAPPRTAGDISKQKCKEYSQYAYNKIQVIPLLTGAPQYLNVLECIYKRAPLLLIGDIRVSESEFPHMALIGFESEDEVQWDCAGSLISEYFVLTAAHCLNNRRVGPPKFVRVGLTNQLDAKNMQESTVSEVIVYPEFKNTAYHDIGLLKLSKKLDFNVYIRPACLQMEKTIGDNRVIASHYWDEVNTQLSKEVLEFSDAEQCNKTYSEAFGNQHSRLKDGIRDDLMICAGSNQNYKDSCQVTSGGPLQVYHDNEDIKCMYDIVGITSFGKSCGFAKNVPGIYTRVSAYLKWIEDTVWPQ